MNDYLLSASFWISVAVVAAAFVIWLLLKHGAEKYFNRTNSAGKRATNIKVLLTLVKCLVCIFALVTVLQINGVNVSSLVTGLGVAGIVVGFALQDILKDLIMGTDIIFDGFFAVGDVVQYKNIYGMVIDFNIKVTKIKDLNTGNIFTVCNRNISEIEKVSDWLFLSVPISYDVSVRTARDICNEISRKIEGVQTVTNCSFIGTEDFMDSYIKYRLLIHCDPGRKGQTKRDANGIVQDVFEARGIAVPYSQIDVHMKQEEK